MINLGTWGLGELETWGLGDLENLRLKSKSSPRLPIRIILFWNSYKYKQLPLLAIAHLWQSARVF